MLKGQQLGEAIRSALEISGISQKKMAADFDVKAPSVTGWLNTGRIDKEKLPKLFAYFEEWVGPDHWGLTKPEFNFFLGSTAKDFDRASHLAQNLAGKVTPRSRQALDHIERAARDGRLTEKDIRLLEAIAERFLHGKND